MQETYPSKTAQDLESDKQIKEHSEFIQNQLAKFKEESKTDSTFSIVAYAIEVQHTKHLKYKL